MNEGYKNRIGNLIRDARKHRGLTQHQLADLLGTSQSAINRIEKGHQNLSLDMLARIGSALAGGLSGLILEDAGRLQIRVAPVVPPADPERPWRAPAVLRLGFRWEPARAATLRPNELATEVLTAFRRAVESLAHR